MKKEVTAFYLETLLLVVVFLVILLVLTQVFGLARAQSRKAGDLTQAVEYAERAAEAVASSTSLEEVQSLLEEDGTASVRDNALQWEEDGFQVRVTWEPEGSLVNSRITVSRDGTELYALQTATRGEDRP